MAIRGVSQYTSSVNAARTRISPKMSNNERLNTLIKRSSVNAQMLKKANDLAVKRFGKASVDTASGSQAAASDKSSYQRGQELKQNVTELYSSFSEVMNNEKLSDDMFSTAVKNFAEDYNDTVSSLSESDNSLAVYSGKKVTDLTESYSAALSRVGISVNDDKTLSVDEKKLSANISDAKAMFGDTYSFGGRLTKKISELESIAQFSGTSIGIYSRNGLL